MTDTSTGSHAAILVRAAVLIDTLDDIDQIAEIGGPMDTLATLREEIAQVEAIAALARTGVDLHNACSVLALRSTTQWRTDWLTRTSGLDAATALVVAMTPRSTLRRYALIADRADALQVLRMGVSAATADLHAALRPYADPDVLVPDTIPAAWAA